MIFLRYSRVSMAQKAWSIEDAIISQISVSLRPKAVCTSISSLVLFVLKTPGSSVQIEKGWDRLIHSASCGWVSRPARTLPEWRFASSKVMTLLVGHDSTGILFPKSLSRNSTGSKSAWPSLSGQKSRISFASKTNSSVAFSSCPQASSPACPRRKSN